MLCRWAAYKKRIVAITAAIIIRRTLITIIRTIMTIIIVLMMVITKRRAEGQGVGAKVLGSITKMVLELLKLAFRTECVVA